jgi:hypothetical protein
MSMDQSPGMKAYNKFENKVNWQIYANVDSV